MNDNARSIIVRRMEHTQKLIDRGKGEWPNPDYVRDSLWDCWNHEVMVLAAILDRIDNRDDDDEIEAMEALRKEHEEGRR